jgi:hypothetical protein
MGGSLLFSPLVLTTNLIFFLLGEVVLDVEGLADLLGRLAFDHVGDGLAADIEESFDVEVVGSLSIGSACMRRLHLQCHLTRMISKSIS